MDLLILGMALFLGSHSVSIVAPGARAALVARLGEWGYKAAAALIAAVGLWLVVRGFAQARLEPVLLYAGPGWLRHVMYALMLPVFPLVIAAYLKGHIRARLKHPMLAAVKFWALAHLLVNGRLADVVLFGSLLGWAVVDRVSLKRRPGGTVVITAPSAIHDLFAVLAGLALYVAVVLKLHLWLIGVSPLGVS